MGEQLSVDRIDSNKGYVRENMQLIALSLNSAKRHYKEVPTWAVNKLLRKLERCVEDRFSDPAGASIPS